MTGAELKRMRLADGLRQVDLAVMIGVSERAVASWERGVRTPRPHHRRALLGAFGLLARRQLPCAPGCGCRCHLALDAAKLKHRTGALGASVLR